MVEQNIASGWFAVKRGITSHPIFHKRPDRTFVWLWMMETAAYKDTRQDAGGSPVEVKRGQLLTSFRQIEAATGVGVQVVRTLFRLLEAERAINTDTSKGKVLVTICNYDKYQAAPRVGNTGDNTQPTHDQHTKETKKQFLPSEGASADAQIDPVKVLFDSGRSFLMAAGKTRDQAGKLLGKWRAEHGTEAVIEALGRAQREGAIDPVSFIEGCFRFKAKAAAPQPGDWRTLPDGRRQCYVNHYDGWMDAA